MIKTITILLPSRASSVEIRLILFKLFIDLKFMLHFLSAPQAPRLLHGWGSLSI